MSSYQSLSQWHLVFTISFMKTFLEIFNDQNAEIFEAGQPQIILKDNCI